MRKYSRMLLAAFMSIILIGIPVYTAAEELPGDEISEQEVSGQEVFESGLSEETPVQHLNFASATHMSGNFFTNLWGRNTSDLDVRALLQGCNLVAWNGAEGMFVTDPSVVSGITVMENEAGDRMYLLTLYDDLYFSDETRITAWDYAFSWLLLCSDEIGELGVLPADLSWLTGYREYKDGGQPYLEGIRVLEEDTLLVTVRHEALPFFYELGLLSCVPFPIRTIAPGVKVFDDGYGVYLANDPDWEEPEEEEEPEEPGAQEEPGEPEEREEPEEPRFTAELLAGTILDPETGYLSHPAVVSGPYILTSWDGDVAEFEANPFYKGDFSGRFPTIETLTYRCLANEDMIPALKEGSIDVLNKTTDQETIQAGIDLTVQRERVEEDNQPADAETAGEPVDPDRNFSMSNYTRTGLTFISFSRMKEAVSSASVRQAIAWCMDRDEVLNSYAGSFGLRTDGYYGLGQWMYRIAIGNTQPRLDPPEDENDAAAQEEYEALLAAWEQINLDRLTKYDRNPGNARALLDEDGWILNDEGLREKDGMVLDLTMVYPAGSRIEEAFEEFLIPNLEEVGIRLTLLPLPMETLLELYYEQLETGDEEPQAEPAEEPAGDESSESDDEELQAEAAEIRLEDIDMFYLGSNFDALFEPEELFAEYAPRESGDTGRQSITGGYIFIDRTDLKGSNARSIAEELEQELSLAASRMEENAKAYVEAYFDGKGSEEEAAAEGNAAAEIPAASGGQADEREIPEMEQVILALTEAAMDRIYASDDMAETSEDSSEQEASEQEIPEQEISEQEISGEDVSEEESPEMRRLRMLNTYMDIYNDYAEMYRDYGSLYVRAMDMRETQPGDTLEYMQKWVRFQELVNEYLPIIPIYSNVYFDFYISTLKGYNISQNITWGNAVLGALIIEEEEPETEADEPAVPEAEADEDQFEIPD